MSVYVRNGKFYVDYYDGDRRRMRRLLRGCPDRETAEQAQKEIEAAEFKKRHSDYIGWSSQITRYPDVPRPTYRGIDVRKHLPESSGIYFFWLDRKVIYVGSAVNLRRRIGGTHHKWSPDYGVSFLEMDKIMAAGAEAYYIGLLRPELNSESRGLRDGKSIKKTPKRPYKPRVRTEKPKKPEIDGLLTVKELAAALSISQHMVYHMVHLSEIPVIRVGRAVRFKVSDVDTWIVAHSHSVEAA